MPKLTLNISEQQLEFVQNQSETEGFAEPSAYIESLVRAEEQRLQKYYYEKCLEGVNSGKPIPLTPGYWANLCKRIQERGEKLRQRRAI